MGHLNIQDVAINLELLKRYRFYQSFDPNGQKVFGVNVYRLLCIIFTMIAQLVVIYATFGYFVEMDDTVSGVEYCLIIGIQLQCYVDLAMITLLFYNSKIIWETFDVVRLNFLTSKFCCKNIKILEESRERSIKFTNYYVVLPFAVTMQWLVFPFAYKMFVDSENTNHRPQNIFNFRFPVTLYTYNKYYAIFYVMEMIVGIFFCYFLSMIDVLFMSFCWVISALYDVLTRALDQFGQENDQQIGMYTKNEHIRYTFTTKFCKILKLTSVYFLISIIIEGDYECFESILFDEQRVYL